jgi:hypothetical protein
MRSKRIITRVALDFLWYSWMKREDERAEAYSYHRLTRTWQVDSWPALILRLSQKPSRLYHTLVSIQVVFHLQNLGIQQSRS